MRTKAPTILLTTTALALGACTTSLQTRLDDVERSETGVDDKGRAIGHDRALRGVTYALPMRQYDIEVKRRLATCNEPFVETLAGQTETFGGAYFLPSLAFELSATATGKLVEGERYLIDYEALTQASKVTEFKIDYHEGTMLLKSVNASADDQTGEIISKTLGAALTIAGFALPPTTRKTAVGAAGLTARSATQLLSDSLAKSSSIKNEIDCADSVGVGITARNKVAETITALSTGDISAQWTVLGIRDANNALVAQPLPAGTTLTDLNERITALLPYIGIKPIPALIGEDLPLLLKWQAQVLAAIRANKAVLEKADSKLTVTSTATWPATFSVRHEQKIAAASASELEGLLVTRSRLIVDPAQLAAELANATPAERLALRQDFPDLAAKYLAPDDTANPDAGEPSPYCYGSAASEKQCLANKLDVSAFLVADTNSNGTVKASKLAAGAGRNKVLFTDVKATSQASADGLFIRPPVDGTLRICKGDLKTACTTGLLNKPALELMPQLGQLRLLPLVNMPFANNGLSVTLAKDGRLSSFTYANKRSVAAAIMASINDSATQIKGYKDAEVKRQTDANAAKLAELQYQIDLAEKTGKVAGIGVEKSDADKQKAKDIEAAALYNAEWSRLTAEQCVIRARAYPDTPTVCPAP